MKLQIKQLMLENFKGIKKMSLSFKEMTTISGCNASGKSTIADAFTWLLFGKDMFNRKDFEIKTVDKNGVIIPRLEHTVTGVFEIDGNEVTLQRTLREKWVKSRGKEIAEFQGNETLYAKNDVPMSQKEFESYIDSIIPESTFKLLTVPTYFNNAIKWQDRRAFLTSIAKVPSDDEIAGDDLIGLLKKIRKEQKSMIELQKELAASKKLLKAKIDEIPARLNEIDLQKPETKDYAAIEVQIKQIQAEIDELQSQIMDQSKQVQTELQIKTKAIQTQHDLEKRLGDIRFNAQQEFAKNAGKKELEIEKFRQVIFLNEEKIKNLNSYITMTAKQIDELTSANDVLREEWTKANAVKFVFDDSKTICPTCKQQLPAEDIEKQKSQMLTNFNEQKQKVIEKINADGKRNKASIEKMHSENEQRVSQIVTLGKEIEEAKKQIESIEKSPSNLRSVDAMLAKNEEYQNIKNQLIALIIPEVCQYDNEELLQKKNDLQTKYNALLVELSHRDQEQQLNARRNELLKEESELAKKIADIEKTEFDIESFNRRYMDAVESSVNKLFPTVKWRMFEHQINGGVADTCICLIDGVPYSDANRAAQTNAGIEIINVFSKVLGITAPIWVDNAEAVNTLTKTEGQLIALAVTIVPGLQVA